MLKLNKSLLVKILLFVMLVVNPLLPLKANGREKSVTYRTSNGRSGVLFDMGFFYGQSEATANPALGNEWKNLTSVYDIKFGYIFESDIYLGVEYSARNDADLIATVNGSAVALGGGYFWNSGFNARAFYRLNETWGDYSDGSGFQADMGYMLNMTAGFHIGFLLSHRQVTFSKNNTITNFNSTTKKDTQPMITIGWLIN